MAAARKLVISKNSVVLAGIITKSISIAGEALDLTDDQSGGWRVLDSEVGRRSMDISFDGVVKDNTFRALILAGTAALLLTDITMVWPNGDAITGDFYLDSLEESGAEDEALKFSGTLKSSGEITFTAA